MVMKIDFKKIKTNSAATRVNLVTVDNLLTPGKETSDWNAEGFENLCEKIIDARKNKKAVILSMGAHVIKNGLARYLIAMMEQGIVTHISGNGACSIHDFELCLLGGTSEHVPTAIEDGSFGMWEETGHYMNEAIQKGATQGIGYGESLAVYMDKFPERFPHKECCVLYQAHRLKIPITYHIALGTDIIHQHPTVDFGAIGTTSGIDFKKMCESVADLENGVFLNFGSGVIGPEVFLKALSIARNLGYGIKNVTTANFDLRPVQDVHGRKEHNDPDYYYRPIKNVVCRPTSQGGNGWHFCGDHKDTIPALYNKIIEMRQRDEQPTNC